MVKIFFPRDLFVPNFRGHLFPLLKPFIKGNDFSDKEYNLKFNSDSEIFIDSEAQSFTGEEINDFIINPEELIRTIKNNMDTLDIIPWDKSPTPWTKMVFKKLSN